MLPIRVQFLASLRPSDSRDPVSVYDQGIPNCRLDSFNDYLQFWLHLASDNLTKTIFCPILPNRWTTPKFWLKIFELKVSDNSKLLQGIVSQYFFISTKKAEKQWFWKEFFNWSYYTTTNHILLIDSYWIHQYRDPFQFKIVQLSVEIQIYLCHHKYVCWLDFCFAAVNVSIS